MYERNRTNILYNRKKHFVDGKIFILLQDIFIAAYTFLNVLNAFHSIHFIIHYFKVYAFRF